MNMPLVSVVIAVKNGERFLAQAIESVTTQNYHPFEIIVVDGHSTDRSVEIAQQYEPVKVIDQTTQGFAGAWNEGIAEAGGEYIAFLDSDDKWPSEKLQCQVDLFLAHPEIQYTIGKARFFMEPGIDPPPGFDVALLEDEFIAYMPGTLMARKKLFDEVGDFETNWSVTNDIEWFKRVMDLKVPMKILPQTLIFKRVHNKTISYHPPDPRSFNREILKILKKSIDRDRRE